MQSPTTKTFPAKNKASKSLSLVGAAKDLRDKGFSAIAVKSNKDSLTFWTEFQKRLPTDKELEAWFASMDAYGLAIICGKISGNLECIDVDTKYDLSGTLFENLMERIAEASPSLPGKFMIVQTRSGGYHLYFYCPVIERNQPLARRGATEEELAADPKQKVKVLIETRGEGGYVVAPPTDGYRLIQGDRVNEITPGERELILAAARSLNEHFQEYKPQIKRKADVDAGYKETPWDDYNSRGVDHMLQTLEEHGWKIVKQTPDKIYFQRAGTTAKTSGDYSFKHGVFAVFTTSSIFEPQKGYRPAAVFTFLECNGDFKAAGRKLAELGYGKQYDNFKTIRTEIKKQKINGKPISKIKADLQESEGITAEEASQLLEEFEISQGEYISTFWSVSVEVKNDALRTNIKIHQRKLEKFLSYQFGINTTYYQKGSNKFIRIRKNGYCIEEISIEQIKKLIKAYVLSLPEVFDQGITRDDLLEKIYQGANTYFSDSVLEFLDSVDLDLLRDTSEAAYYPFSNGVIRVTKDKKDILTYEQLGKHVWKNSVKDFDIKLLENFTLQSSEFYRFLTCICGADDSYGSLNAEQTDRLFYLMTLIGYILHKYKDPSRAFAVILAEETDSEEKGGGTGKGILYKAIAYLNNTVEIDGKNWKSDKPFLFQRVSLDTEFIALEDTPKYFDFEKLYNVITEGITVERKNKDEIYIPYSESPKIGITTNYAISQGANHSKRRQQVFEFYPFFSPRYTPEMHFGHKLFNDWDADEWTRFYNLMFCCVGMYLDKGILQHERSQLLKVKEFKQRFTPELYDWIVDYLEKSEGCPKFFGEAHDEFLDFSGHQLSKFSKIKFKSGITFYCELFAYDFTQKRDYENGNRFKFTISRKVTT